MLQCGQYFISSHDFVNTIEVRFSKSLSHIYVLPYVSADIRHPITCYRHCKLYHFEVCQHDIVTLQDQEHIQKG